ncbi:MAG: glycosyltransferase family 2 protein [Pseudomonadales bacterium]
MLKNKKIIVVMPAYNAALTLEQTWHELPMDIVDDVILVDDASVDNTAELARSLDIKHVIVHDKNLGYGGNQKTCYRKAIDLGADIIIMVHPDYQYTPKLIHAMSALIAEDLFDCVLGSRILGVGALEGGMPRYKYVGNRFLTFFQNLLVGYKLSEYHTGYRAFSREVLESIPLDDNSNDFIFDNQILLQIIARKHTIGEVTCPTLYTAQASSIGGAPLMRYGLGVLSESIRFRLTRWGLIDSRYRSP